MTAEKFQNLVFTLKTLLPHPPAFPLSLNLKSEAMAGEKRKKKTKRGGGKKKLTPEQALAMKSIYEWVHLGRSSNASSSFGDFLPHMMSHAKATQEIVFDLHSHSIHSDGFLCPAALVEKAHQNGVKVLSLTDHDTMSGIPEALEAARRFGIKIIPGVEISTMYCSKGESASEEPVHILAYYSSCGPARNEVLEKLLASIRDGRFIRAKNIISKLNGLKMPIKWEHVSKIAGAGVAPGRLHVARALLEAGHVENLKQAFSRYLYDGGPAYSKGTEPLAEDAVQLICETGGVAVLAHPWALKNPVPVIKRLAEAGLHGIEVYRSDGKLAVYSDLADSYGLVKIGGSDFHGRGGHNESSLGSVSLPVLAVRDFLEVARPIWYDAIKSILDRYIEDPSELNFQWIDRYERTKFSQASNGPSGKDLINRCLSSSLTKEEMQNADFQATMLRMSLRS